MNLQSQLIHKVQFVFKQSKLMVLEEIFYGRRQHSKPVQVLSVVNVYWQWCEMYVYDAKFRLYYG